MEPSAKEGLFLSEIYISSNDFAMYAKPLAKNAKEILHEAPFPMTMHSITEIN